MTKKEFQQQVIIAALARAGWTDDNTPDLSVIKPQLVALWKLAGDVFDAMP